MLAKSTELSARYGPEYWIADSDARVVERWRPKVERPEIIVDILVWQLRPDVEPLSIGLETLFAGAP
jgi:hypothetical protein